MNSCPLSDGYIRLNILQVATHFPQYWEIIHGTGRGGLYQGTFFPKSEYFVFNMQMMS